MIGITVDGMDEPLGKAYDDARIDLTIYRPWKTGYQQRSAVRQVQLACYKLGSWKHWLQTPTVVQ